MAIDRAFIAAKIARLSETAKGRNLTEEQQRLLQGATADHSDGKYAAANAKLNRLHASFD